MHVLLVGNPNCGKTTVFNALTGNNQRVGNWPGVTVEKKTGHILAMDKIFELTDLPGIYSLSTFDNASQDEQITTEALANLPFDLIINVIDACHLERHLYLSSQLLELGKPIIFALNMMDLASQRGIDIDVQKLKSLLGCPVVTLQANKKIGFNDLLKELNNEPQKIPKPLDLNLPRAIKTDLDELCLELQTSEMLPKELAYYFALRVLEGDKKFANQQKYKTIATDVDIILADARYSLLNSLVNSLHTKISDSRENLTAKVDKIVLHRFWGLPIFFLLMYAMFFFAINGGGIFQDFFDLATKAIFIQGLSWLTDSLHAPLWLSTNLVKGLGVGINTTLTFVPIIATMFFFLALFENSGYMARAAFVIDRFMRFLGLPGKSFIPLIIGFGCNVPAVMATRTLDSEKDRLLTIFMVPFMSCTARLAIYAIFVSAFFPKSGGSVVFALYVIGIMMAVLTGFLLRKLIFNERGAPLILELPLYQLPSFISLLKETFRRLRTFIIRAARMIIPICVFFGALSNITLSIADNSTSILALIGKTLTPIFHPMGITDNNWPATVGLLTGMLAKEVVIGSLNSLYTASSLNIETTSFFSLIQEALWSIPDNFCHLYTNFLSFFDFSPTNYINTKPIYLTMLNHFDGKAGAFAYLLFILLYIPCLSTMAAVRQEANRRWMYFSIAWSLLLAYVLAVLCYQSFRFIMHPLQSFCWIGAMLALVLLFLSLIKKFGLKPGVSYALSNS